MGVGTCADDELWNKTNIYNKERETCVIWNECEMRYLKHLSINIDSLHKYRKLKGSIPSISYEMGKKAFCLAIISFYVNDNFYNTFLFLINVIT